MTDANNAYRWQFENDKGYQEQVNIAPVMSVNDLTTMRTAMIDGAGIGFLPEYLAKEALKLGQLKSILPEWHSPVIPYYVLYPSHMGLTRKARVWIDFFSERLGTNFIKGSASTRP